MTPAGRLGRVGGLQRRNGVVGVKSGNRLWPSVQRAS